MDSAVRAVGRMVVWVDAEAEVNTEIVSRNSPMWPRTLSPNSTLPIAANTSLELSGFAIPIPVVPGPAKATAAVETST